MKRIISALVVVFVALLLVMPGDAYSQFGIYVQPASITGLPGLHSYVWGKHGGKWLVMGGRIDGLHRRQPTTSFDVAGNNNRLIVVDPVAGQQWSAPITTLPVALQEQLSSTNMEYHQHDTMLYCIGGYGYSATAGNHITFSNIVAVNISRVIDAVINNTDFTAYFRYQTDPQFAVTGGHLEQIYDVYYLIGGNKFDGRYNPMGGASYTQQYTNQIRRFTLHDDGTTLSVVHLPAYTDAANLHRRDYNAVAQIMPDGKEGVTAFSGVFQATADIPFLNCVNIDSAGYALNTTFSQYYNHYHCANLPVYSAAANEMHTVFFGGIAQYYDSAGVLVADNNVPFVKTIARVTRTATGAMAEYKLPVDMPGLLGAGSELIPADGLPTYGNHVLKLDDIAADTTFVGYVYGGISSSAPNIFPINTGIQSSAYNQLLKVYLVKGGAAGVAAKNNQSASVLKLHVYPNPSDGNIYMRFHALVGTRAVITVTDLAGAIVDRMEIDITQTGEHLATGHLGSSGSGTYMVTVETPQAKAIQKVVIRN